MNLSLAKLQVYVSAIIKICFGKYILSPKRINVEANEKCKCNIDIYM